MNAIATPNPYTPVPQVPLVPPISSFPSPKVGPAVLSGPPIAAIELIIEHGVYVALIIPRELTQTQLLIAEHILPRGDLCCKRALAEQWNVWRVYAKPLWAAEKLSPQSSVPGTSDRPTGPKLFFA